MSRVTDRYREWDAAYVLGALSSDERREYEAHVAGCEECAAAVAELAGIPGLLAAVDLAAVDLSPGMDSGRHLARPAPDLLPRLLAAARHERQRTKKAMAGALVGVAAVAAALALILPAALGGGSPTGGTQVAGSPGPTAQPSEAPGDFFVDERVDMSQVVPSPLSADFRLAAESWGSRIETRCRYSSSDLRRPLYNVGEQGYGLYVTDTSGQPTVVATWSAAPGSSVEAVGSTRLRRHEIARVDIRSLATGQVLLASTIGG
ncbi:MAG TPA: zf-HC2 domain-containing protein [Glaciibacter sp.]|nr:zf-HC2 domain-containing protein [Glaciibacter sp.]